VTGPSHPPVSPAAIAEWRRRREASTEPLPPSAIGQPGNGFHPADGQPGNGFHPRDGQPGNGLHPPDGQPGNGLHPPDGQPGNGLPPPDGQHGNGQLRHVNGQPPHGFRRHKWRPPSGLDHGEQSGNGQLRHANEQPSSGLRVPAYVSGSPPPETAADRFAEAQRAGLAAMMSLAAASAPPQLPPIVRPRTPGPEPSAAPPDPASAVPAQRAPDAAELAVLDRPADPVPPVTVVPGRAPETGSQEGQRQAARSRLDFVNLPVLSLIAILTVQSALSLRLVWSNSAFTDEALYLWAGHLEWAHWLHGTPIPPFPTYFSGAPVIYPPIGAIADSLGGLAGARILSLCFMLVATALLWATTSRLFGKRAGFFAAGLWAFLGPTLKLGGFATFDAMSLFLMALSAWCAVRAAETRDFTRWIVASAAALVMANATTYSSAIFDPVVVALALLAGREQSAKLPKMRAASLAAYVISVLIFLSYAGRGFYWTGVSQTVLNRLNGANPAAEVLGDGWRWTGSVAIVALVGVLVAVRSERNRRQRALLAVLAAALLLVPLEQARLHTITSLDKHSDFGAWFAAIAAGYAAVALTRLRVPALVRAGATAAAVVALAIPLTIGFAQAWQMFGWPDSRPFVKVFRPLAEHSNGPMLVESLSPARYYLGTGVPWQRWSSTWAITLPDGQTAGRPSVVSSPGVPNLYTQMINKGFFVLVALNSTATPGLDREITQAMVNSDRYRLVKTVGYNTGSYFGQYVIWERIKAPGTS
jgi:Dolichyl-phosphate-mannose-protein mannosyltransferase